jgi:hypothetical protein
MNKMTLVKKIIGKGLEPYDFTYYGKEPNSWIFSRRCNEVEQFVCVYDSMYEAGLRIELYTSLDMGDRSEIDRFYPKWEEEFNKFFWEYTDEQSIAQILNKFLLIIVNYGLQELERLSIPTREKIIKPSEEMQKELYENHDEYCKRFIKKYDMQITDMDQVILNITAIMKEKQDEDYEVLKELLIEMAAYYGTAICHHFDGRWSWEVDCCCYISFGNENECLPLQQIVFNWRDIKFRGGLSESFNEMFL